MTSLVSISMLTAEQLRAARAILQMDQADLAKLSGISVETIKRLERQTGMLHAKVETLTAIQGALEAHDLEFLGDREGRGAGVRLVYPDRLKILRETLLEEWAYMMDQWLKAECATDPKLFEQGATRLINGLTEVSARILPTVVQSVLSALDQGKPISEREGASYESSADLALSDAKHITADMLELIDDATNLMSAQNLAFTRAFVAAIPACQGPLTNTLSGKGLARAKNAVLVKAYGNAILKTRLTGPIEALDDEVKSISTGLLAAAPVWAKFRAAIEAGDIREELDMTADLIEAVKRIADLRARGEKLHDYIVQKDVIDHLLDDLGYWMRAFYDPREKRTAGTDRIASALQGYVQQAYIVTNDPRLQKVQNVRLDVLKSLLDGQEEAERRSA